MRFTIAAATALFGAAVMAAPAPQATGGPTPEAIAITDMSVRKQENGTVTAVGFTATGPAGTSKCSSLSPAFPTGEVFGCDSTYSFALVPGTEWEFGLRIYRQTAPFVGLYGQGDVFTYCHAGGLGDLLCAQLEPATITIS